MGSRVLYEVLDQDLLWCVCNRDGHVVAVNADNVHTPAYMREFSHICANVHRFASIHIGEYRRTVIPRLVVCNVHTGILAYGHAGILEYHSGKNSFATQVGMQIIS